MKKATHHYNPLINSKMRTIRYADEVWTPTGIVDSIRFEDYIVSREVDCKMINYDKYDSSVQTWVSKFPNTQLGKCKIPGKTFPNKNCTGCFFRQADVPVMGMCTTCFECKISLSDFKSDNGHNFHGNRNYYVVPKELIKKIEDMVPKDIGILMWIETKKFAGLRMYRECEFKEITETLRWQLLYNAMKKWCDGAVFVN